MVTVDKSLIGPWSLYQESPDAVPIGLYLIVKVDTLGRVVIRAQRPPDGAESALALVKGCGHYVWSPLMDSPYYGDTSKTWKEHLFQHVIPLMAKNLAYGDSHG